ncbi:deleted in malignant brain tumors 1 protein-like [Callorhinchus milii]|uniref:deleted in malignant brain tumors 1 protein-like n=1 Tax=Callorhinchus milii TaxID=7868 RepID=UPI001C3FA25E|nr:deleted in malignant brain tumors 1 protein-like [Callorhinchus milii]
MHGLSRAMWWKWKEEVLLRKWMWGRKSAENHPKLRNRHSPRAFEPRQLLLLLRMKTFVVLLLVIFLEGKTGECAESVNVRLVNGNSPCAGRVELYHRGEWGTVDGFGGWNMKAAAVVCKELSCGKALSAPRGAYFGKGSGCVVAYNVQCRGFESALRSCPSGAWGHNYWSHSFDVGVICSGSKPPRLVNGGNRCVGRVEMYTNDTWGTLCGETLNMEMAGYICKYLECGFAVSASGDARFGKGSGPVVGWPDCGHVQDGGIFCSDPLQKPNISMKPDSRGFVRGESVEISCSGSYPGSNFSLYRNGDFIISQSSPENNNTATFTPSEIIAGNYSCKYTTHIDGRELTSPESEGMRISLSGTFTTQGIVNVARLIVVITLPLVIIFLLVIQYRPIKKDNSEERVIEDTT